MLKKVYIKTYGCQMNVYDSMKMADLLKPHGYCEADEIHDADLVILNTCHIREKAAEKVYSELGRIREYKTEKKQNGGEMVIAVAGCVAQAEGEEIIKRAPYVDIVVGPQTYYNLPLLLEQVKRDKKWAIDIDFPEHSKFDNMPEIPEQSEPAAFLSIQEGCDKFCHFCVVPYTRGAEESRPTNEVYREAMKLVAAGAKEIHLLGQNVSAYHGLDPDGAPISIARLIRHIATIKGVERIRYTTSHPNDMHDEELYAAHRDVPALMPYLHLPVQSGSSRILKAMNRKHTREEYLDVIAKFRAARPDMAFSSDFIVGYPGETDEDFEDTMRMVDEVQYAQCYSFKYSPRPGTPASALDNQVPEKVKAARLQLLQEKILSYQTMFNYKFLGETLDVLFDKPARYKGQIQGKSPYMQTVFVQGDESLIGTIAKVRITKIEKNTLGGELV